MVVRDDDRACTAGDCPHHDPPLIYFNGIRPPDSDDLMVEQRVPDVEEQQHQALVAPESDQDFEEVCNCPLGCQWSPDQQFVGGGLNHQLSRTREHRSGRPATIFGDDHRLSTEKLRERAVGRS